MIALTENKSIWEFKLMQTYRGEVCSFTTSRHGGVSSGNYGSFNLGIHTSDDPACIEKNLSILKESLPVKPTTLVIPHQVHSDEVLVIDESYLQSSEEERKQMVEGKDALITRETGVSLCITTADCIPLVFFDRTHHAVAVAHAGWRGTVKRIGRKTLEQMSQLFGTEGKDVLACLGPGISLAGLEVGDEVYDAFRQVGFPMERISEWKRHTHKYHINLWLANRIQLTEFGIPENQIEMSGICTYMHYQDFFSARRLGAESGRMLTGIFLTE